jgi:hypothetical protein
MPGPHGLAARDCSSASEKMLRYLAATSMTMRWPRSSVALLVRTIRCASNVSLDRAAPPVTPDEAIGTHARWCNHDGRCHDHGPRGHDDGAAIDNAAAIRSTMETGPASARGIGRAKACDSAGKQDSCKNRSHVSSMVELQRGQIDHPSCVVDGIIAARR